MNRVICAVLAFILLHTGAESFGQSDNHYTIGTGSTGATFYPLAKALCTRINEKHYDFTCAAVSTPGSFHNLNSLENGAHALALSQLPLQYQAYAGLDPFSKAHRRVATIAPLHQEVFILAVRPDSNIDEWPDIRGKRINIGNAGSGSRIMIEQLFRFLGLDLAEFEVYSEKSSELPWLMCSGEIDGAIYSTGHPNAIYARMIRECGVKLVDLWDENIAEFVARNWQFGPATIEANSYRDQLVEKRGFGVQVVLSADIELPADHAYQIVQTLVEDNRILAERAPVFRAIDAALYPLEHAAPYHSGAERYYNSNRPDRDTSTNTARIYQGTMEQVIRTR